MDSACPKEQATEILGDSEGRFYYLRTRATKTHVRIAIDPTLSRNTFNVLTRHIGVSSPSEREDLIAKARLLRVGQ